MELDIAVGRLLVASPVLMDPNFYRSVVLLCRYDPDVGTMGLVLNRPTQIQVGKVLPQVASGREEPLWVGGPVDARSLCTVHVRTDLRHAGEQILEGVHLATDSDLIRRILATTAPDEEGEVFRLFVGYAGWGEGQLEDEIAAGAWRIVPAVAGTIFNGSPLTLWQEMSLRSLLPGSKNPRSIEQAWMN
jgi:putative transcriptional regulator